MVIHRQTHYSIVSAVISRLTDCLISSFIHSSWFVDLSQFIYSFDSLIYWCYWLLNQSYDLSMNSCIHFMADIWFWLIFRNVCGLNNLSFNLNNMSVLYYFLFWYSCDTVVSYNTLICFLLKSTYSLAIKLWRSYFSLAIKSWRSHFSLAIKSCRSNFSLLVKPCK